MWSLIANFVDFLFRSVSLRPSHRLEEQDLCWIIRQFGSQAVLLNSTLMTFYEIDKLDWAQSP